MNIIEVKNISKSFLTPTQEIGVLFDISFTIERGEFVIIYGPSGCGKSTLLHSILGLEKPTKGVVKIMGHDVWNDLSDDERSLLRKEYIGMVYQQPSWIKAVSVLENVAFPTLLLGKPLKEGKILAETQLKAVGMTNWKDYLPVELSSGQQQIIALGRALVNSPQILVADEPTGNMDFLSGEKLMEHLKELNKKGQTVVMVTHDLEYLTYASTVIKMFNGRISGIFKGEQRDQLIDTLKKGGIKKILLK